MFKLTSLLALLALFLGLPESLSQECAANQYKDGSGNCVNCKDKIANCEACTSSYNCLRCAEQFYLLDKDWDGTHEVCEACLSKDRYLVSSNKTCQLCSNLISGCSECESPRVCTKCRTTPLLTRFRVESADKSKFSCSLDCADGQYKTVDKTDGTGLCQFCSNLVEPNCRNCQPIPSAKPAGLYKCTQCSGENLKLIFKWNADVKDYNVACGSCDVSGRTSFIRPGNDVGKDECKLCEYEWPECETCEYKDESNRRCLTCKKDRFFDMGESDEKKRKCMSCSNTQGFSKKMKDLAAGTFQCFSCPGCANCTDETRVCNACENDKKVLMPNNLTCVACEPKSHVTRGESHCVEVPYIPKQTWVEYNETSWTARIEMYCSVPSRVFWVAATNDQAITKYTGEMIRDFLKNNSATFWRNTTRNPDYLMMGVLDTSVRLPTDVYYAVLTLSEQLKANARYSIIHFCENQFGVMSLFYDIDNWTVQDNGSRDLEMFLLVQDRTPSSEEKFRVSCEVAKLLGELTTEEKVVTEEGISCSEGKALFGGKKARMIGAVYEDDTVVRPPRYLTNISEPFMAVFIEKDFFARTVDEKLKKIVEKMNASTFVDSLQKAIDAANIAVKLNKSSWNLTERPAYSYKWPKATPALVINFNESLPQEILKVPATTVNETLMWVEFTVRGGSGFVYMGFEKAAADVPSPSTENFRMGRNFLGKPLDNFTILNGLANETYRFVCLKVNKSDPHLYRFCITVGDYYPAPFQSISAPQCHIFDINQTLSKANNTASKGDGAGVFSALSFVGLLLALFLSFA